MLREKVVFAGAPTPSDDVTQGYVVGSRWIDTSADGVSSPFIWWCANNSAGAAIWLPMQQRPIPPAELPSGIDAAKIANGSVSNAEFQFINTVTSNVQTQLNGKAATSHTHLLATGATDVTATAAEVNRLSGVTSNVQTQLDGKKPFNTTVHVTAVNYAMTATDELCVASPSTTITLPSSPATGRTVYVKNSGVGTVTVNPAAGNIDDQSSIGLSDYQSGTFIYDGTQWRLV